MKITQLTQNNNPITTTKQSPPIQRTNPTNPNPNPWPKTPQKTPLPNGNSANAQKNT